MKSQRINITATVSAIGIALLFILPAVWILGGSFRPSTEIFGSLHPLSWRSLVPTQPIMDNYTNLLSGGFKRALFNSFYVCVASVVIGLILSAFASYALSVFNFKYRNVAFAFVVVSFMIPFEAVAIPLSTQFADWNLNNTYLALILPGIGNGLAIFNLRQHFLSLPSSYREAARVDGAGEMRILGQIYVPLSGAALSNSALLIFLGQWGAYLWPLLATSSKDLEVAPIALAGLVGEHETNFGQQFAGAVMLSLIPALLLYLLQKFFGGLSVSSGEK